MLNLDFKCLPSKSEARRAIGEISLAINTTNLGARTSLIDTTTTNNPRRAWLHIARLLMVVTVTVAGTVVIVGPKPSTRGIVLEYSVL
jgi:hypothetical protein